MTPEELVVGRRNLAAELRDYLNGSSKVIRLDRSMVRDLIEVLDQPVGEISDEAVEAACQRMYGPDVWGRMHGGDQETKRAWMRYSLEAAAPLLGTRPQPTLDRNAAERLAAEWRQQADQDERYLNRAHASEIHDVYASIRINREHADAIAALLDGTEGAK